MVGVFMLFVGFYVCGLLIRSPELFCFAVVAFHFADALWFVIVRRVSQDLGPLLRVIAVWIWLDVLTVRVFIGFRTCCPPNIAHVLFPLALLGFSISDGVHLRDFYFPKGGPAGVTG